MTDAQIVIEPGSNVLLPFIDKSLTINSPNDRGSSLTNYGTITNNVRTVNLSICFNNFGNISGLAFNIIPSSYFPPDRCLPLISTTSTGVPVSSNSGGSTSTSTTRSSSTTTTTAKTATVASAGGSAAGNAGGTPPVYDISTDSSYGEDNQSSGSSSPSAGFVVVS